VTAITAQPTAPLGPLRPPASCVVVATETAPLRHGSILPAAERFASLARLTVTVALLSVASSSPPLRGAP
jgi:hypothetical protein